MADAVDQSLFTQEELVLLTDLSMWGDENWLRDHDAKVIVQMARRLALRVSRLQESVEANGS